MTHKHNCYSTAVSSFQGAQHPETEQCWLKGISKDAKLLQSERFQSILLRCTPFDAERGKKINDQNNALPQGREKHK